MTKLSPRLHRSPLRQRLALAVPAVLLAAGLTAQTNLRVPSQFPTIASAIAAAASSGDTIWVDAGTYNETGLDFAGKQIVLRSVSGAATTVIDGGGSGTILSLLSNEPAGTRVQGFTFRNGSSSGGGGIRVEGPLVGSGTTFLEVEDCIFENNAAPSGGGGGVSISVSTDVGIRGCRFVNNSASSGSGGGVFVEGSFLAGFGTPPVVDIEGCTFLGNSAPSGSGGGVGAADDAQISIRSCVFARNSTPTGGGSAIALSGGFDFAPTGEVLGCTITANDQTAVRIDDGAAMVMRNTIVWGNNATPQIGGSAFPGFGPGPSSLNVTFSDLEGGAPAGSANFVVTASDNVDVDPLFVAPASDDFRLTAASTLIDAGDPAQPLLGRDASGNTRSVNGDFMAPAIADIGAEERVLVTLAATPSAPLPATSFSLDANVDPAYLIVGGVLFAGVGETDVFFPVLGQFQVSPTPILLQFDLATGTATLPNPGGAFGLALEFQAFCALLEPTSAVITLQFTNTVEVVLQ
jgi:hypothetical protein